MKKSRSETLQPEYTLPSGERLKQMARIGLALAKVQAREQEQEPPPSAREAEMLTPFEREELRRLAKERHAYAQKAFAKYRPKTTNRD